MREIGKAKTLCGSCHNVVFTRTVNILHLVSKRPTAMGPRTLSLSHWVFYRQAGSAGAETESEPRIKSGAGSGRNA
jgi:hypothetical protein